MPSSQMQSLRLPSRKTGFRVREGQLPDPDPEFYFASGLVGKFVPKLKLRQES